MPEYLYSAIFASLYIKLQDHEKRKTRAYAEDISKYYNMKVEVFEDEQFYICHDGRELRHIRTETKEQNGYTQTFEVYGCAYCSGCEHKARCLYKYNAEKDTEKNSLIKSVAVKIQTRDFCGQK